MKSLDDKTKCLTTIMFHDLERPNYVDWNNDIPFGTWYAVFPNPRNEMGRTHMIAFLRYESDANVIVNSRPEATYQTTLCRRNQTNSIIFELEGILNLFPEATEHRDFYSESRGRWHSVVPHEKSLEQNDPLGFFQYMSDSIRVQEHYSGLASVKHIDVEVLIIDPILR